MTTSLKRAVALYVTPQFARFLVVGGVALTVNWLSRFVFNWFVSYGWAVVLAYLAGIVVAFTLNKIYVFTYSERPLNAEMAWFLTFNIIAFPFVWAVAYLLGEKILSLWMPREIALALAHGIAIALPVFVNFALHKFITFRGA